MKWLIVTVIVIIGLIFFSNNCEGFGRGKSRGSKSRGSKSRGGKSSNNVLSLVGLGNNKKKHKCSLSDCTIHCLGRKDKQTCHSICMSTNNCKNII